MLNINTKLKETYLTTKTLINFCNQRQKKTKPKTVSGKYCLN